MDAIKFFDNVLFLEDWGWVDDDVLRLAPDGPKSDLEGSRAERGVVDNIQHPLLFTSRLSQICLLPITGPLDPRVLETEKESM